MAILSFSNLTQSFGDFDVFVGASGNIPNGGKVGIVGPNGIGKTTLLKALAGLEEASGNVHIARGTTIGYLRQEAVRAFAEKDNSVWQEMLTVVAELVNQGQELAKMEAQMAEGAFDEELLETYSKMQTHFEAAGGYDYEIRIKSVLTGLGFNKDQFDLSLTVLSGGQKTRALLARLLLEKPDLLILDEPTNHLDINAVEWLESVLKTWEGAVLIVSHDRYFLDKVVDTIWELSRAGIEAYRGNYSHYVTQRAERWALRENEFDTVQQRFLKELDFIKRNIARDSTKDQAVGRLKRLIREVKMVQVGGISSVTSMSWSEARAKYDISGSKWEVPDVEYAIKGLPSPSSRWDALKMHLPVKRRSGDLVLRTFDLRVGYNGEALFGAQDIELRRKEIAALIGPNGAGKTSFIRTLLERIPPVSGEMKLGASLDVSYFAQAHDELDHEQTVLNELMEHSGMLIPDARNYLGRFLFRGDDVYKPIKLLSGGERGRLALGLLAFEKANFLLMDEPTNHLDIPAQEALQDAMGKYEGTILMVSHDRYLINALATQVWEVKDGKLNVYHGGYQAYLSARDGEVLAEQDGRAAQRAAQKAAQKKSKQAVPVAEHKEKKQRSKNQQRRFERELAEAEQRVTKLESMLEEASAEIQVASALNNYQRIQKASNIYAKIEEKLAAAMEKWEALADEA